MKHYITSGCSFSEDTYNDGSVRKKYYGTWSTELREYIEKNNLGKCYSLGLGGSGVDWVKRSIIYQVMKLLNNGIKSQDIKVVANWPFRTTWDVPILFRDDELRNISHRLGQRDNRHHVKGESQLLKKNFLQKFGLLDGAVNEDVDFLGRLVSYDRQNWFNRVNLPEKFKSLMKLEAHSVYNGRELGSELIEYLDCYETIFLLQLFLENKNIDYVFFSLLNMKRYHPRWSNEVNWDKNSKFSKSFDCDCQVCQHISKKWPGQYEYCIGPNYIEQPLITEKLPHVKLFYDQIDWDKWWFYKSDKTDFGGCFEYILEKCKFFYYHSSTTQLPPSGQHPNRHAWEKFFHICLLPFMEKKNLI